MEILNPVWLLSLISVPIVLILLLIAKKPRRIEVPSLLIWKRVAKSNRAAHSKTKRIDSLIVLLIFIILFICLTLSKLVIATQSKPVTEIEIFVDDSVLMKFETIEDKTGKDFVTTEIKRIANSVDDAVFSIIMPISRKTYSKIQYAELDELFVNTEFEGFISYEEYVSTMQGFLQQAHKNSIKLIFTPFSFKENFAEVDNIKFVNIPFKRTPEFIEHLGFDRNLILARLTGNSSRNTMNANFLNGEKTSYPANNRVALIDNLNMEAGCFTINGEINKYFSKTHKFKIGSVGIDEEFIDFANKTLRNVEFTNSKTFSDSKEIDAWLIAGKSDIPEGFNKPIIYISTASDEKWFSLTPNSFNRKNINVNNTDLMEGVSVSELDFSEAQNIDLVSTEWDETIISSDENILAGILIKNNIKRGFINIGELNKNNISTFLLILNMFEYLSHEKIIDRADYFSLTPNEFFKYFNKKSLFASKMEIEINSYENNRWIKTNKQLTKRNFNQLLNPLLKKGAIVKYDEKLYAVNVETADLSDHISEKKSINPNTLTKFIDNHQTQNAKPEYFNLDIFLLLGAIIALFTIVYFKKGQD